ncbi:DDHD-domain-containing protein [Aspergillus sclerotioniger CBS 115572]|uniref:DDHD-domain-containing protein n=1 Tax=Aspergillus sclerotioniger CBS 115572 TaxID=1450535 RepID=A0A317X474_9EURO|nr:DDHD-domain-containing protein [Aspergillus sclerotioniger CBS 115572]PWY93366.1 DDHD-domain-containing protein [Aspergillus sclerotioniger CBS 115572]
MSKDSQKGTFFGAFSPWNTSRSTSPQPFNDTKDVLQRSRGEDHTVTHRHGLSLRRYPKDCPPLRVKWFYAVDSPKSKPGLRDHKGDPKPLAPPKKFVPFTCTDSQAIEDAFQGLLEADVETEHVSYKRPMREASREPTKVPVNEDSLFDVNIEQRELSPAYWIGPIYEVRRGTWFFQDGSTIKPCEENLATQLEEGFLKSKPWRYTSPSYSSKRPVTDKDGSSSTSNSTENVGNATLISGNEPEPYRLFGAYMNSIVTYQDSSTALLMSDDFMSRMSTTFYQKLGGVPGTKLVRGFIESKKQRESPDKPCADTKTSGDDIPDILSGELQEKQVPRLSKTTTSDHQMPGDENASVKATPIFEQHNPLAGSRPDMVELEEQARKQEQKEMEDSRKVEDKDREIDHLILVTHGIGQRLSMRLESVNFIHDINVLRKTLKSVYRASPDLQALNSDFEDKHENCRVQVLPVCWRHLLDFPYQKEQQSRMEFDLGDAETQGDISYPSLSDITLDNVPAVRNLISDLAMDVLLYQSAYCEHISRIVKQECNRILDLYKRRNPSFRGTVSLCGHSLGSAILFDILCHEQQGSESFETANLDHDDPSHEAFQGDSLAFECEDLFCLGSPIALFQMLKGKTIAGRPHGSGGGEDGKSSVCHNGQTATVKSPPTSSVRHGVQPVKKDTLLQHSQASVSSPNCRQLFNIFHPSDPVSYRLEPLISPAMSSLKPQPLPSVKRGLWTTSGQSLSMISSRVGQSVGSLWTNFTSGVASSLLNRSLGLTSETASSESALNSTLQAQQPRPVASRSSSLTQNARNPTLIDSDLETLYEGYRRTGGGSKRRGSQANGENPRDSLGNDHYGEKLLIEDAKVRALNSNGRVDYSIQEGTFDISMIASIASHLSYWSDEDVCHFMMSQMLCRKATGQNL